MAHLVRSIRGKNFFHESSVKIRKWGFQMSLDFLTNRNKVRYRIFLNPDEIESLGVLVRDYENGYSRFRDFILLMAGFILGSVIAICFYC